MGDPVRTPFSRVWTIEGQAGPANVPVYQGQVRAMGASWAFGDRTPVREPDPGRYNAFRIIDAIKGERDLPALPLEGRYQFTVSEFLRMARIGCPLDVQVHFGKCQDPRNFDRGWDKILVLEGADFSNWSTGELGALEQGQDAIVNEPIDLNGLDMYEVKQLKLAALAGSQIVQEVLDVAICDSVSCGICGIASNGCQRFFALQSAIGGSPGLAAEIVASADGGATLVESNVTSLAANQNANAMACVGTYLAVVSQGDISIHYALIADIFTNTETWVENIAGLVNGPNDIFSLGSAFTWVVGQGGYVYFYSDITAAAVTQNAGVATAQNLNAIDGIDENNLVAVGASNAVIYTRDGSTWVAVTGPSVGIALNAVAMRTEDEWYVGDASGNLWYTRDAGVTWTAKAFPGSGSGVVYDIVFATPTVGYLAHTTSGGAGRILRTVNGGQTWYVLPEGTGSIPSNQRIGALAACGEDVNVVYGGGLGVGTDGILVQGV